MSAANAKTSETNAATSANTAKAWSMSDSSPDGVTGNKSAKTWAEEAKTSASNSANSASASNSSVETAAYYANEARRYAEAPRGQAPNGSTSARLWAETAGSKASAAASSASAAASSASDASASASNAKISETNASNSAKAAKQSEENSKTWDPTQYVKSVTESNGKVTVTKGGGESTTFNAGLNILARNKAYAVGDIAYSPNLPSYLYLECTTAGTTGETEPDMPTVSGAIVNDGTAKFSVKTVCAKEYVDACVQNIGKKIQYGTVTVKTTIYSSGQQGNFEIPVDFPDTDYGVQLTLASSFPYFGDTTVSVEKKTTTSFTGILWVNSRTNLSSYKILVEWLAIHK